jgi:hypothetical protein
MIIRDAKIVVTSDGGFSANGIVDSEDHSVFFEFTQVFDSTATAIILPGEFRPTQIIATFTPVPPSLDLEGFNEPEFWEFFQNSGIDALLTVGERNTTMRMRLIGTVSTVPQHPSNPGTDGVVLHNHVPIKPFGSKLPLDMEWQTDATLADILIYLQVLGETHAGSVEFTAQRNLTTMHIDAKYNSQYRGVYLTIVDKFKARFGDNFTKYTGMRVDPRSASKPRQPRIEIDHSVPHVPD